MNIIVINKRNKHNLPNTVYVGRPSVLGNPFSHLNGTLAKHKVPNVLSAVLAYEHYIYDAIEAGNVAVLNELNRLINIVDTHGTLYLECWCKDELSPSKRDHAFHADIIKQIILDAE